MQDCSGFVFRENHFLEIATRKVESNLLWSLDVNNKDGVNWYLCADIRPCNKQHCRIIKYGNVEEQVNKLARY
ncbi:hypothetical protein GCM10011607_17970 [Shewanella inventionis]|uniref:Uncharacterized protein n=1 Tax=Shewanella inventionis TaxID=1738770 RepID=A0ABQ1J5D2_9GAMM|nr:hypothetical protein GCM10011607_17970 [Shewanella inventionis]